MNRTKIIIIVALVLVLVIILLVVFKDKVFAKTGKINTNQIPVVIPSTGIFPLKNGSFNLDEVSRLQTYLKSKGGVSCNGNQLIIDGDFGSNTECATKQILGVAQVSQILFNSLGI